MAPQLRMGEVGVARPRAGSGEDCLTINVIAGSGSQLHQPRLPVMVFIHGGGYAVGSSQDFAGQGESFVASAQLVYVSFNYRLGALGYLDFSRYSSVERPLEGNLGLRDQRAALDWVQKNIAVFGGDPANVTVFGESAGGSAVTALMATPSARGLFARAIAQSSPTNAVYPQQLADGWAAEFVGILRSRAASRATAGRSQTSPAELLVSASVDDLITACSQLQQLSPDSIPGTYCLAPVVDGSFLPERPLEAFRAGRAHPVPLIIGTNDREGALFVGPINILPRTPQRMRALIKGASADSHVLMREAYPGLPHRHPAADFGGDFAFWYPSIVLAGLHSRFAPVHVYRFDIAPRMLRVMGLDATHGIELFALFDRVDTLPARVMTVLGGRDVFREAGRRMRRYWTNFATDGTLAVSWPAYDEVNRLTLIIDTEDRVESDPRRERRLAWEAFIPEM